MLSTCHDLGVRLVFMYGGGNDGGEAGWPSEMAGRGHIFLERPADAAGDDPRRDAERLIKIANDEPVHLVAVSYGGIAAVLAAHQAPSQVRSLTLFEPTCADLAREATSVLSFRRSLEFVVRQRSDPGVSDSTFLAAFQAALGEAAPGAADDTTGALAKRLRATPMPWEITLPRARFQVPTLVVTGGWSEFFEDIASALVRAGAVHRILSGHGHWVPGHPEAAATVREFAASNE
jgi:pimeloyl-ACP methyl ester carboxylesterase